MTPDELKEMALKASKQEYENIVAELEKAAKAGSFSCNIQHITDGARKQLEEAGFIVLKKYHATRSALGGRSTEYYEVKFGK